MRVEDRPPRPAGQPVALRPLSPGQQGILLQHNAAPGSPIFNVPAALELTGPLDEHALRRALTDLVARHEVLRTTFPQHATGAAQAIHPPHEAELPVRDLGILPAAEQTQAARELLDNEAAIPFDLEHETSLRCRLVRLDTERHVLFWMMHHIICDGWSKAVFATDLSALYAAHHAGTPSRCRNCPSPTATSPPSSATPTRPCWNSTCCTGTSSSRESPTCPRSWQPTERARIRPAATASA